MTPRVSLCAIWDEHEKHGSGEFLEVFRGFVSELRHMEKNLGFAGSRNVFTN